MRCHLTKWELLNETELFVLKIKSEFDINSFSIITIWNLTSMRALQTYTEYEFFSLNFGQYLFKMTKGKWQTFYKTNTISKSCLNSMAKNDTHKSFRINVFFFFSNNETYLYLIFQIHLFRINVCPFVRITCSIKYAFAMSLSNLND